MRLRVRSKLMLSISIPLIITYVVMLGYDYIRQRQEAIRLTEDLVLGRATLAAGILDARLMQVQDAVVNAAERVVQRIEATAALPGRADPRSFAAAASTLQYDWAAGIVIAMEDPGIPGVVLQRPAPGASPRPLQEVRQTLSFDHRTAPWYTLVKDSGQGQWFTPGTVAGILSRPTLAYSAPIVVNGLFRGVVSVHVNPQVFRFNNAVRAPRFARSATGPTDRPREVLPATRETTESPFDLHLDHYLIISREGEIVYHSPEGISSPANLLDHGFDSFRPALITAMGSASSGQGDVIAIRDLPAPVFDMQRGKNYWVATVPFRSGQWIFLSTYPEAQYMDEVRESLVRRAAFLAGGLCFLLAIVVLASRRISRPLEELDHSTNDLDAGHLDISVPVPPGRDEIAELSRKFNAMVQRLRAQVQQIKEESEARARVEGELQLAREIQTSLLPREMLPHEATQFDIHACNLPASHVAGDFYDFFVDSTGRVLLVIADVAGHGVPAALLMAVTRTLIRNLGASGMAPAEIVVHTNRSLLDNQTLGMFVTLVLCVYDPHTGEVTYVNAGHPAPLVMRAGGPVVSTGSSTAPLLGAYAFEADDSTQKQLCLGPGDALVLYTDGIVEAKPHVDAEDFGEKRFCDVLERTAMRPLAEVCQGVVAAVENYRQGPLGDDVTMLIVRRT